MTKLLYTKQEIIDGIATIAKLVAEINLRDDRPINHKHNGTDLILSLSLDDINVRCFKLNLDEKSEDFGICNYIFYYDISLDNIDEAITKLTNFKWSDIDEK